VTTARQPLLLDGGMGRELRARGVPILETIWSANALLVAPEEVVRIHRDEIAAGADVITTNTTASGGRAWRRRGSLSGSRN
jgi:S-methylmethionine-dependent homocysteine/selenocysteine methylase